MPVTNVRGGWSSGALIFTNATTGATIFTISATAGSAILSSSAPLVFGTGGNVTMQWDGTNFLMAAAADNTVFEIGDSAASQLSFDIRWYGTGANGADNLLFDASANQVVTTDIDFKIQDNDMVVFGTGTGGMGDARIVYDGTNLNLIPQVDDDVFEIGDAAVTQMSWDVRIYGNTSAGFSWWDASEDGWRATGIDYEIQTVSDGNEITLNSRTYTASLGANVRAVEIGPTLTPASTIGNATFAALRVIPTLTRNTGADQFNGIEAIITMAGASTNSANIDGNAFAFRGQLNQGATFGQAVGGIAAVYYAENNLLTNAAGTQPYAFGIRAKQSTQPWLAAMLIPDDSGETGDAGTVGAANECDYVITVQVGNSIGYIPVFTSYTAD